MRGHDEGVRLGDRRDKQIGTLRLVWMESRLQVGDLRYRGGCRENDVDRRA